MLNTLVPASAEGMPKFNRSEIMKDAWREYRREKAYNLRYGYPAEFMPFSQCLRLAWRVAKTRAREAAQCAADMARKAGERIIALRKALEELDCKSFRFAIIPERRELESELERLLKEAA